MKSKLIEADQSRHRCLLMFYELYFNYVLNIKKGPVKSCLKEIIRMSIEDKLLLRKESIHLPNERRVSCDFMLEIQLILLN